MESNSSGGTTECCDGTGGLSWNSRLLGISLSFLCFCSTFILAWSMLNSYYRRFPTLSLAMQADVSSRVNSVIHSAIVVPILITGIAIMPWGGFYQPLADVSLLQSTLCISLGYFMCDTVLLFIYQPPQWLGFAAHHIVASIPYAVYMFAEPCPYGLFILACFMLVEATNIPLHARGTLHENNMGSTKAYAVSLYLTFVGWIIFRLANPTFLLIVIHRNIIPSLPPGRLGCILPGVVCAYLINIFCYAVFVFVLCKEVVQRWKASPEPTEIAPVDAFRPVDFSKKALSEDEQNILSECPSRMLIYETQESIRERIERTGVLERIRPNTSSDRDTFSSAI